MAYQLTPAQIELQAARKAAKLAKQAQKSVAGGAPKRSPEELELRRFLRREWVDVRTASVNEVRKARVISWNLLAQTLVRRELFPGSDCLRWSDRKPMLLGELEHHGQSADILCFQECDRLRDLLPSLPQHGHVEAKGLGKLHGLVVLYRSAKYRVRAFKTVYLDDEHINEGGLATAANNGELDGAQKKMLRGGSRLTKNIALMVALEETEREDDGIVVSTAHLFWHPKFAYERTRQTLSILRNNLAFRKENNCEKWPSVIAGDFNTEADETTYQLLVAPHQPVPTEILADIQASRFVHTSVDNLFRPAHSTDQDTATAPATKATQKDDDGEGEEELPDTDERSVRGTRPVKPEDGIPETEELIALYRQILPDGGCKSAYTEGSWATDATDTFSGRGGFESAFGKNVPEGLPGSTEPGFTCFTPLFKLSLDYLFLLPSPSVEVTKLLRPANREEMGVGLPRKGICASDHIAVGCEIEW